MLDIEDARSRILAAISAHASEHIPLESAAGRILTKPVVAPTSLPPFDNSAMDGYAVRSADIQNAAPHSPVTLTPGASVAAGESGATITVEPGTCVRVFTGSPLPAGADAVVMQEDTRRTGSQIEVLEPVKPWENVRLTGEDIRVGAPVLHAGERIKAGTIALLGALGLREVVVGRRPVIGIISTGNELADEPPLSPGQIFESNRNTCAALLRHAGALPKVYPLVRDNLEETKASLVRGFSQCDCILTTGGVSVGEHDLVKAALAELGGTMDFWRIAMKPGKPFLFARLDGKLLFGLPGNPVSAFVTCVLLVVPAVWKWQGAAHSGLMKHPATLAQSVRNRGDRLHFMRVSVDEAGLITSSGMQASHALQSLGKANALLAVPPQSEWPEGRAVEVIRWEI